MSEDNIVYIESKPIMNYCMAVIESLRHSDSVALKARGRARKSSSTSRRRRRDLEREP